MTEQMGLDVGVEPDTQDTADVRKLGYVGAQPGAKRDSDSWFTPPEYIDAAREALGGRITLDPFSSHHANEVVRADRYFTEEDDAFAQVWAAAVAPLESPTVWMNPPYSGQLVAAAVDRFLNEYALRSFAEGVFIVNNATETRWFQRSFSMASAVCFTDHRISFWNADGKKQSGNTRGQAFFYFGPNPQRFIDAFDKYGTALFITNRRVAPPRERNKAQRVLMEGE